MASRIRIHSPVGKSHVPIVRSSLVAKQQKKQPTNAPKLDCPDPKFNFDLSKIPISSPHKSSQPSPKINPKLGDNKSSKKERETESKNSETTIQTLTPSLPEPPQEADKTKNQLQQPEIRAKSESQQPKADVSAEIKRLSRYNFDLTKIPISAPNRPPVQSKLKFDISSPERLQQPIDGKKERSLSEDPNNSAIASSLIPLDHSDFADPVSRNERSQLGDITQSPLKGSHLEPKIALKPEISSPLQDTITASIIQRDRLQTNQEVQQQESTAYSNASAEIKELEQLQTKSNTEEQKGSIVNVSRPSGYENIDSPTKALAKEEVDRIFIETWDNPKLVKEAKTKDIYLRGYSQDLGSEIQSVIAETLVLMFQEMDKRVKALPLKFDANGILVAPEGIKWSSEEFAGVVEGIDPFQMCENFWEPLIKKESSKSSSPKVNKVKNKQEKKPSKSPTKPPKYKPPRQTAKGLVTSTKEASKREQERKKTYKKIELILNIEALKAAIIAEILGGIVANVISFAISVLQTLVALVDNDIRQEYTCKIFGLEMGLEAIGMIINIHLGEKSLIEKKAKLSSYFQPKYIESVILKSPYLYDFWYKQQSYGGITGKRNEMALRNSLKLLSKEFNRVIDQAEQKYRAYLEKNFSNKEINVQYQKNIENLRLQAIKQLREELSVKLGPIFAKTREIQKR